MSGFPHLKGRSPRVRPVAQAEINPTRVKYPRTPDGCYALANAKGTLYLLQQPSNPRMSRSAYTRSARASASSFDSNFSSRFSCPRLLTTTIEGSG